LIVPANSSNDPETHSERGVLRPASDIIARSLGDAAVLIRLQTNSIYELNGTGARIWSLLKAGRTKQEVIDALLPEFDIERDALTEAVDELVGMLRAEGLVDLAP
jgi:hypothetical protein